MPQQVLQPLTPADMDNPDNHNVTSEIEDLDKALCILQAMSAQKTDPTPSLQLYNSQGS